jgi:hypothetical protein
MKIDNPRLREFLSSLGPHDQPGSCLMLTTPNSRLRADIMTSVSGLDFDRSWADRHEASIDDEKVCFISIADLLKVSERIQRPQDLVKAKRIRDLLEHKRGS